MLAVGNVAVCSAVQGASAPTGRRGRWHTMAATHLQLVLYKMTSADDTDDALLACSPMYVASAAVVFVRWSKITTE